MEISPSVSSPLRDDNLNRNLKSTSSFVEVALQRLRDDDIDRSE